MLEEQLRGELLEGFEQSDQICVVNYHSGHFTENRLWWGQGWKHGSCLEGHVVTQVRVGGDSASDQK